MICLIADFRILPQTCEWATASAHNPVPRCPIDADLYLFKVPSLRNVAMMPPYFHDGSVATLDEALQVMARVQLGSTLTDDETHKIVAFLRSLRATPVKLRHRASPTAWSCEERRDLELNTQRHCRPVPGL